MNEKFNIGDFGNMEFILRSGGKKNWFDIWVTILEVDRYWILIQDNNGHPYLIQKRDVKKWVKGEFINKAG